LPEGRASSAAVGNYKDESKTLPLENSEMGKRKKRQQPLVYFDISPNGAASSQSISDSNTSIYRIVRSNQGVLTKPLSTMTEW